MRYLCIDLGDKRTGLAIGDAETRLVTPLRVVEVAIRLEEGAALIKSLKAAIEEQLGKSRGELVVGLPINMDDSEGQRAKLVRAFGARLEGETGRRVHYQDERLTSAAADWSMARSGMTRGEKKQRRDALAAAEILKDFLEALPRG